MFPAGSIHNGRLVQWFYSLLALILAVIMVTMLLTVIKTTSGRYVKDWRCITDAYIDSQSYIMGERAVIGRVVQANKPDNLTEKLALTTFGEGMHFALHEQPGMGYGGIITQVREVNNASIGKRRLPYPPQALWCVYLDYTENQDGVVFLGYHIDMYSA